MNKDGNKDIFFLLMPICHIVVILAWWNTRMQIPMYIFIKRLCDGIEFAIYCPESYRLFYKDMIIQALTGESFF